MYTVVTRGLLVNVEFWNNTEIYRGRWQVGLFFKCIKQHLRVKAFFGTSANATTHRIGEPRPCADASA
jgi:hypothetical protein